MSTTIDLKLTFFDQWHAKTFLRMLRTMELLGDMGHHGDMTVFCDGDGNFKLDAKLKTGKPDAEPEYIDLRQLIEMDYHSWEQEVKRHKEAQAGKNPEIRDNSELQFSMGD